MTTIANLQVLRDKLINARASGISLIHDDTKRIAYKTDAEMAAAIADLDRRIASMQSGGITTVQIFSSKGLKP
jgi:hypothetical protein